MEFSKSPGNFKNVSETEKVWEKYRKEFLKVEENIEKIKKKYNFFYKIF